MIDDMPRRDVLRIRLELWSGWPRRSSGRLPNSTASTHTFKGSSAAACGLSRRRVVLSRHNESGPPDRNGRGPITSASVVLALRP
jgi:hypothetical protein